MNKVKAKIILDYLEEIKEYCLEKNKCDEQCEYFLPDIGCCFRTCPKCWKLKTLKEKVEEE